MEDQHTGAEETLMEVTVGMKGKVARHPARAQPRRGCFKCLFALATLLALAISLVAALVVYIFIFAPQCSLGTSTAHQPAKDNQVKKLPPSSSQGTFDIFIVNKSAEYFIYGWLRFTKSCGNNVHFYQTSMGQQRTISSQKANKTEMSFFQKIKLVKGSNISISLHCFYADSLFHMYEL